MKFRTQHMQLLYALATCNDKMYVSLCVLIVCIVFALHHNVGSLLRLDLLFIDFVVSRNRTSIVRCSVVLISVGRVLIVLMCMSLVP